MCMKLKRKIKIVTEEEIIKSLGLPEDAYILDITSITTILQGGSQHRKFEISYLTAGSDS